MIVRAETARVFGNLSRRVEIRQCFQDDGQFVDILSDLDSAQTIRYTYFIFMKVVIQTIYSSNKSSQEYFHFIFLILVRVIEI